MKISGQNNKTSNSLVWGQTLRSKENKHTGGPGRPQRWRRPTSSASGGLLEPLPRFSQGGWAVAPTSHFKHLELGPIWPPGQLPSRLGIATEKPSAGKMTLRYPQKSPPGFLLLGCRLDWVTLGDRVSGTCYLAKGLHGSPREREMQKVRSQGWVQGRLEAWPVD